MAKEVLVPCMWITLQLPIRDMQSILINKVEDSDIKYPQTETG